MNKNDLMMKAVIQLNGEMARKCNGLVYATNKNQSFPEGGISHWSTDNKWDFLSYMCGRDTWKWLCTRAEFYQFIDDLLETCIKWDSTEWEGEGLPPVGTECEMLYSKSWIECIYKGRTTKMNMHIVEFNNGQVDTFGSLIKFRQIKTEAEKEIDSLTAKFCALVLSDETCNKHRNSNSHSEAMRAVIDCAIKAGWRPNKENK